ncbi:MAG TPA: hypothetical protein PLU64_15425 [Saprospiraceae bacterium]|nr:hypothetical protein [Saprospiraceae bacterium]
MELGEVERVEKPGWTREKFRRLRNQVGAGKPCFYWGFRELELYLALKDGTRIHELLNTPFSVLNLLNALNALNPARAKASKKPLSKPKRND